MIYWKNLLWYLVLVLSHLLVCSINVPTIVDMRLIQTTCRTIPGFTKEQIELCLRANDVTMAALDGLELAIYECQNQFRWHRWNCSSLSNKSRNPYASNLLKRGYRESAFAYAIAAAGVAHNVARACSQGRLLSCGCDPSINRRGLSKYLRESLIEDINPNSINSNSLNTLNAINSNSLESVQNFEKQKQRSRVASRWKWGGCSHNMDFGAEFAELFLDARERGGDIQSQINLHNNRVGRQAVANNMVVRCKCHGMSGSCQLKTCWRSAPDFGVVGRVLKQQFRRAVLVDQSNVGNGPPMVVVSQKNKRRRKNRPPRKTQRGRMLNGEMRKLDNSLFYYQRSPNFCEKDPNSDIPGTSGRRCNRTSSGSDGCASMCCGRGYSLIREQRVERCHCSSTGAASSNARVATSKSG
ncbi:LOW QUALITY PROTEIN: protein Wnt-10b [Lutzomyia longipalpis]|uniref:LOW QUALITY PROTEIN: protein Wnt-10b n=1 Tax=Lutzomyia longipalpis TaxID=7200 RepID=UPI002483EA37|nr:LOW QUALITY PROTEIN: protein Wnt-10b [Lutzomyia longipalpis]